MGKVCMIFYVPLGIKGLNWIQNYIGKSEK